MKTWKTLTIEELASLDEKQIEMYDKLICAEEGIPFMDEPEKPELTDFKKDLTVYKIGGVEGIAFTDVNEANTVVEILSKCKSLGSIKYNYNCTYFEQGFKYYDGKSRNITMQSEVIFSEQTAKENYEKQQENNKLENNFKDKFEAFRTIQAKRLNAVADFYNSVNNAKNIISNRTRLLHIFYEEYFPLTDGNATLAMTFLKKAYDVSEDDEKFILTHDIKAC